MENREKEARGLFDKFWQGLVNLFTERRIKDVDSWSGAASNYDSTAAYCDACLINLNEGDRADWTQANCKLPVRGPGDGADTYVRQAVHAAAARFNQVDAPADAKEAARRKLVSIYQEMDEEPPEVLTRAMSMSRLYPAVAEKLMEMDDYLADIYTDDDGMLYALCTNEGKLYRHSLAVSGDEVTMGERVQVMESFPPVATRTIIRQQPDGHYRWFSISGTATLNRSGEIDSRDLFDSFVAYAEETGEYPIRQFYHQGEMFKTGQADFLARDGYCYITSGLYDDTPLALAEVQARQTNPDYWGDSIGFLPAEPYELFEIARGIKIPVYHKGVNKEISTLPESDAAHLFTRTEVKMLDGKAWEAFVKLWGDDEDKARQWLEANPQARNRAIEETGMITRQEGEIEIDDGVVAEVVRSVLESEAVKGLSAKLTEAETQLTQRAAEIGELKATVAKLTTRLDKVEGAMAAEQQQLEDDTPAKLKDRTRVVYRPRAVAGNDDGKPYSERAAANIKVKGAY